MRKMFTPDFDSYQGIIVQNVIKAKSFTFCYEVAKQLQKPTPNAYITKLRQLLKEDEWNVIKKLHKVKECRVIDKEVQMRLECTIGPMQ